MAANRDEFHGRPAAAASFWSDRPGILAGRDLQARGTWMGVSRSGRFAAVTNYRGAREPRAERSRGALVTDFLQGRETPAAYVQQLLSTSGSYGGFNLLVSDGAVARLYADARVARIYGGTSEVMKSIISKSLGL